MRALQGVVTAIHDIDIDNFHQVTGRLGNKVGQQLMDIATARLQSVARKSDAIVRFGDDQFLVSQADIKRPSDVAKLASRLVDAVRFPYEIDRCAITIGAIIGIAMAPRDGTDVEDLLAKFKEAHYRARLEALEQIDLSTTAIFSPA